MNKNRNQMIKLFVLLLSVSFLPAFTEEASIEEVAKKAAESIIQKDYEKVFSLFNQKMKEALPQNNLKSVMHQIHFQYGEFENIEDVKKESKEMVVVNVKCKNGYLDFRISVDKDRKIQGLFFAPGYKHIPLQKPGYLDDSQFAEEEVLWGKGKPLPGTLCLPVKGDKFPVVLLIHGSGPNDRDETIGPNKIFRDIARGLAFYGIASLRYEKITKAYRIDDLINFTQKEEVIDPALGWINFLKQNTRVDSGKIFLIGHSQGGNLIPRICRLVPGIKGAVIMAGNVTPVFQEIYDQYSYLYGLDGKISADEEIFLKSLKEHINYIQHPEFKTNAPKTYSFQGLNKAYLVDVLEYKPLVTSLSLSLPMLILNGKRDYQVTTKEFDLWKKTLEERSNVSFKLYEFLNHCFMEGKGPGLSTPEDYNVPGYVSDKVIKDISDWILKQTPGIKDDNEYNK